MSQCSGFCRHKRTAKLNVFSLELNNAMLICKDTIDNVREKFWSTKKFYRQNTMCTTLTIHLYFDKILISATGGQFQTNHFPYIVVHHFQQLFILVSICKARSFRTMDGSPELYRNAFLSLNKCPSPRCNREQCSLHIIKAYTI